VPERPGTKKTKAQAKEAALDPDGLG